ncbi:hypothetical protein OQA88_3240 [Cercophora sp. LCS_1]
MSLHTAPSKWPSQLPTVFDATASSLVRDAKLLVDQTKAIWDRIVADDENAKQSKARVLRFYASTSPSKELRDASNVATTILNDADAELYSRADIFILVDAVLKKIEDTSGDASHDQLSEQSKYYIRKLHRKMLMNGCGIANPVAKKAFEQVNKRIKELVRQCTSNLHEDSSGLWLSLQELDGVPPAQIAALEKQTATAASPGLEKEQGKLWIKTKLPHPNKVLSHAKCEGTRKKIYYAIKNRLPQNIPLFRELVLARDTLARMLGYGSYLAYKTADKMVQRPEMVTSLLAEIQERIRPAALADVADLLAIKKKEEGLMGNNAKLFAWDEDFYLRLRKQRDKPDHDSVPEYFELHNTLESLLNLYGRLFGTRFERITPERQSELGVGPLVWHEDVQMYAVWDVLAGTNDTAEFLGYAYFDLFPREGKYGHRGCYGLGWGYAYSHLTKEDRFHPSCILVMNFPKPAEDGFPTLLSLLDVRRLFHELGHLHHTLCMKVEHVGLSEVDRDFGEAPAPMLERFFWKESYIKALSHHYSSLSDGFKNAWLKTKARTTKSSESSDANREPSADQPPLKLPDRTIAELADTNPRQFVNGQVFNLFLSLYDVLVHHPATHEDLERMNLAEEYNKLHTKITCMHGGEAVGDGWEWAHGESVFRMIVSGGRVHSLDMWKVGGFDSGVEDKEKEAGRRFRRGIFEPGSSQPEMKTLINFLGREPSSGPYFEWLGI